MKVVQNIILISICFLLHHNVHTSTKLTGLLENLSHQEHGSTTAKAAQSSVKSVAKTSSTSDRLSSLLQQLPKGQAKSSGGDSDTETLLHQLPKDQNKAKNSSDSSSDVSKLLQNLSKEKPQKSKPSHQPHKIESLLGLLSDTDYQQAMQVLTDPKLNQEYQQALESMHLTLLEYTNEQLSKYHVVNPPPDHQSMTSLLHSLSEQKKVSTKSQATSTKQDQIDSLLSDLSQHKQSSDTHKSTVASNDATISQKDESAQKQGKLVNLLQALLKK